MKEGTPCFSPIGKLKEVPGVGVIGDICVATVQRHSLTVEFLTGTGSNYGGLAYVTGSSPPPDSCSASLGGPWLQLRPLNRLTMSCARGYDFTGGG
jgi:hypothetical protein